MRKLLFITLLASVFSINSFSQEMLQGKKTWYTVSKILLPPYTLTTIINTLGGDTIINGMTYRCLLVSYDSSSQPPSLHAFVRETIEGKVYFRTPGSATNPEYLAYDFSAGVGDTIWYHNLSYLDTGPAIYHVVLSIDTQFVAGKLRRGLQLDCGEKWTESIGSSGGIMFTGLGCCACDQGWILSCYFENDTLKYSNSNYSLCYYNTTGTNDLGIETDFVKVIPNPVSTTSILKIPSRYLQPSGIDQHSIEIFDSFGRNLKVERLNSSGDYKINQSEYSPGIYFYRISNSDVSGKFIIN